MTDYQLVLHKRTGPHGTPYQEVRRWSATPEAVASFHSGELLHLVQRVDGVELQVRVELIAPDGDVLDTYTGPHPDDGPAVFRQVATAGRRGVANVWAALIAGADPGPVPEGFEGELSAHHLSGGQK